MPQHRPNRRDRSGDRPRNRRRAVSQATGRIATFGDPALASTLAGAWRAAEGDGRILTHGLHPWPARLHPLVARRLIAEFSRPGDVVVDPFAGSGTVLVEALAQGRRAIGGDVNLVAARISRWKTQRLPGDQRRAVESAAAAIGSRVRKLVREGELEPEVPTDPADSAVAKPRRPSRDAARWFEPDVLAELEVLRAGVAREHDSERRRLLELVLSSIAVRVSRKDAETVDEEREGRPPRGAASRFFIDRALEFGKGMADLCRVAPRAVPDPLALLADARALPLRDRCADLVLTSPPYLGTYDYAGVQALRASLFALDLGAARRLEIGSRSHGRDERSEDRWESFRADLARTFAEMGRVLRPAKLIVVVIGDSFAGHRRIDGLDLAQAAAASAGLEPLAAASEDRPRTFSGGPRREHLVALRPL